MQGERRRYPRISTELPVEVRKDGETVAGTISDLSSTGLQVVCSPSEAQRFQTRGQQIEVLVRFDVPLPENAPAVVKGPCKLVFARRIAADAYCVGLNFLDIDEDSFANLARYMESRLD